MREASVMHRLYSMRSQKSMSRAAVVKDREKETEKEETEQEKEAAVEKAAEPMIACRPVHTESHLRKILQEWNPTGEDSVPPDFICPLSLDVMVDPVVIASGQTYERAYIERWFALGNKTCPKTNQALPHTELLPNHVAKAIIADWCSSHQVPLPDNMEVKDEIVALAAAGDGKAATLTRQSSGRKTQFRGQRLQEFRAQMLRSSSITDSSRSPPMHDATAAATLKRSYTTGKTTSGRYQSMTDIPFQPEEADASAPTAGQPAEGATLSQSGAHMAVAAVARTPRRQTSGRGQALVASPVEAPDDREIALCIEQAGSESGQELREAAGRLRAFSKISRETRTRVAQLGAIPVLVRLMRTEEPVVVEHAVTAVLNLALEMELKRPIAVAGAIAPLVDLLGSAESATARENAVGAISNLSVAESNRALLHTAGVLALLLAFLRECASARARRDAAIALFNLSLDASLRQELLEVGTMELLVDLLDTGAVDLEEELVLLLYSLTKCPEGCERILEAEGVAAVASVLEGRAPRSQAHAVAALLQVAQGSGRGLAAVRAEVVFASLVVVAENGTQRGKEKALSLVKLLRGG